MTGRDSLGRRSRTERQPTGKKLTPTKRDRLWFQKLHQHGPLPTSFLHAFSRHLASDYSRAVKRMADLFHEEGLLDRPAQQFDVMDARSHQLVYDINARSDVVLRKHHLYEEHVPKRRGTWRHRFMTACITASLEIGTLADLRLRYIPQHEILARADVGLRVPITYTNASGKRESRTLVPDAVCGIEYRKGEQRSFRFFAIEADRHTEPIISSRSARKSYARTLYLYREFIGRERFREHFKIRRSMMLVLNVTTNETHMRNIIDLVADRAREGRNSFMLFQAAPCFGDIFCPPEPLESVLSGAWFRAGLEPAFINRP